MKEKLYTIPVNDAFHTDCECPICQMHRTLEMNAIEFVMGPSYMEDDVRMETDRIGFCSHHLELMYQNQNRLGLALMLKTHMDRIITDLEKLQSGSTVTSTKGGLFRKKADPAATPADPIHSYIETLEHSCYVCNRIEAMYQRYLATVFYLYRTDEDFRQSFRSSKGFCTPHYDILRRLASEELTGNTLTEFIADLDRLYIENMKRVRDDLEWFTDKFDYRNADAPWKNSKDALPRSAGKVVGPVNIE